LQLDSALHGLNDAQTHAQAEPGSLADFLGGVKGEEDLSHLFRRHSLAGVSDRDFNRAVIMACAQGDFSGPFDGVSCVVDQVQEYKTSGFQL